MQIRIPVVAAALAMPALAFAQHAAVPSRDVCINASDIEYTQTPDDQTIIYHLRNGRAWKNTLKAPCPQLHFEHAFTEVVRASQVCANHQMIRVQNVGSICALGDFTLVSAPPPAH